jgi:hypothetical protein
MYGYTQTSLKEIKLHYLQVIQFHLKHKLQPEA